MDLADVRAALVEEIKEGLTLIAGHGPVAELGGTYEALSEQLEGLALCYLLLDANLDKTRENLIRSAHARRHFLRRSAAEQNAKDRHLGLARTRAFLDAMVAGHLILAREIAEISPDTWDADAEYEDDFCYLLFLQTIARRHDPFPTPEQQALLARFERSLEGGASARLDACAALVARDASAFVSALGALLDDEQAQIDVDRDSTAVLEGDVLFWPHSYVSVEGLALLKFAELIRIPVAGVFPRCPPLARFSWTNQATLDFFEVIERA